jgi:glycerophosphoryl diester phosphodiesterase
MKTKIPGNAHNKSVIVRQQRNFGPRPFYAIAHNPNTIKKVEEALDAGANAIEPDVNIYKDNPLELCISHDEGDSEAPSLQNFLTELHAIAKNDYRLALVVFDCKKGVCSPEHGLTLLTAIRNYLTFDIDLNIIISVSSLEEGCIFNKINNLLGSREGLVIDEYDDPVSVSNYFQNLKVIHQCYGNGISVLNMPIAAPKIRPSIERACSLRAATSRPSFIYVWAVNDENLQREFIHIGVDGIFSDDIKELVQVVTEPQFQNIIRMATRIDNPFEPLNFAYSLKIHTADLRMAGTDANLTFTLTGSNGSSKVTVNTKLAFRMERNNWNYVTLQSPDLGDLISITVQRDNGGIGPDWYLDKIIVESSQFDVAKTAIFNKEINSMLPTMQPFL